MRIFQIVCFICNQAAFDVVGEHNMDLMKRKGKEALL